MSAHLFTRIALLACLAAPALAQNSITADQPWARATAPRQSVGGAYVALTSPAADRLVGASTPVAGRVEVHNMTMDSTVMRMREQAAGLPLPAGQTVALTPGGHHLMLMDLKQPLVTGQTFPLQLRFQHAAPMEIVVQVAPVGSRGPASAAMPGTTMPGMAGHEHAK